MILRLSSTASRLTLLSLSAVLAGSLVYFSLRNARAENLAGSQAPPGLDRAVQLEPGNARHWYLLGHYWQYNLDQPDTARAIRDYRSALSFDPRSPATWLDLADAYEAEGDEKSAREAFLEAKSSFPISADVAWRYGNFLLRRGEVPAALAEIRRSLVAEPGRAAEAVSVCWRAVPDMQTILDHALPATREVYLSAIGVLSNRQETDAALAVWARLAALQPKLKLRDVNSLVDALLFKKQIAAARKVWTESLAFAGVARPDDPAGSLIWDGGFETDVTEGFAWRIQSARGAQAAIDGSVRHSGSRSLRIHFDGSQNTGFEHVCEFAAVEPGASYQFSAWMRAEAVTTDRGVHFRLYTPGMPANPPAATAAVRGTEPWTRVTLPWTAGKDVHLVQVCVARSPSEKLDNKIAGTVWVDDITLIPETAAPAQRSGTRPAAPGKPGKKGQP